MRGMKSHSFLRQLILVCLCLAMAAIVVGQYRGRRNVTRVPLTIMKETGFLTFKAHLNGKEILMAVDTAANTTTFDMGLVEELQLSSAQNSGISLRLGNNDMPIQAAHVKDFRVGNLSYHGDFSFVDLSRPNRGIEASGDPPIQGLLGADILVKWNAAIDYKDSCLIIRNR